MAASSCDVLIAGAGPAGAALATLLARAGHSVVLVHRPAPESGVPDETVVGSARPPFSRLGLGEFVLRPEHRGPQRHGMLWGSDALNWRSEHNDHRGWCFERTSFDSELRSQALAHGAQLIEGAVRGSLAAAGTMVEPGTGASIAARYVVAAGGRSASDALGGTAVEHEGPETLAFTARVDATPLPDASVIEAVREGWLWWLPSARGDASLTLFADREEVGLVGREALWRRALDGARGPAQAVASGALRGTSATARLRLSAGEVLVCGDNASALDPLASQGLEKSLYSAWEVAACIETLLRGAVDPSLVFAHHRSWERGLYRAHARDTTEHYLREQRFPDAPFWRVRHATARALRERDELPARFEPHPELKPATVLRRQADALEPLPGWALPDGDTLSDPGAAPMVGPLLDACRGGVTLPQAIERASRDRRCLAMSPKGVARDLQALWRIGFLVSC